MSALLIAYGLTGDWKKICVVDTERGSANLYSHPGSYYVLTLEEPFTPEWFIEAILQSKCHIITTLRSKTEYVLSERNGRNIPKKVGMAAVLVNKPVQNVTCYDSSAGSGTLLMNLAHAIGEDKCTIYSQDISRKSSNLLRLNLILNNLVHSIQNIIQGNTLLHPYPFGDTAHPEFDFIVSNPPFKLDFSDFRDDLDKKENHQRFFAGIPKIPHKDKDKMAIYLLFIQHIIHSLSAKGKAAVVVPTGFITAQSGIEKKIREKLVEEKMLAGVVSMPGNIFAATGTNVSILFIDEPTGNRWC